MPRSTCNSLEDVAGVHAKIRKFVMQTNARSLLGLGTEDDTFNGIEQMM